MEFDELRCDEAVKCEGCRMGCRCGYGSDEAREEGRRGVGR